MTIPSMMTPLEIDIHFKQQSTFELNIQLPKSKWLLIRKKHNNNKNDTKLSAGCLYERAALRGIHY